MYISSFRPYTLDEMSIILSGVTAKDIKDINTSWNNYHEDVEIVPKSVLRDLALKTGGIHPVDRYKQGYNEGFKDGEQSKNPDLYAKGFNAGYLAACEKVQENLNNSMNQHKEE